jgi:hypothetical protein
MLGGLVTGSGKSGRKEKQQTHKLEFMDHGFTVQSK